MTLVFIQPLLLENILEYPSSESSVIAIILLELLITEQISESGALKDEIVTLWKVIAILFDDVPVYWSLTKTLRTFWSALPQYSISVMKS